MLRVTNDVAVTNDDEVAATLDDACAEPERDADGVRVVDVSATREDEREAVADSDGVIA